jgi:hypothetical protein
MAVKINDNRKEWDKFKKKMSQLKNRPHVAVGVLGKEGAEIYEDDTATTVDVATFNEFGTDTIPARSFIRATYERDQARFLAILRRYKLQLVRDKITTNSVLTMVGQFAQKQIQATITAGGIPFKPNSPVTVERKGSSAPLIDSGQLRQSIRYEVRNGN